MNLTKDMSSTNTDFYFNFFCILSLPNTACRGFLLPSPTTTTAAAKGDQHKLPRGRGTDADKRDWTASLLRSECVRYGVLGLAL